MRQKLSVSSFVVLVILALFATAACSPSADTAPDVAAPSVGDIPEGGYTAPFVTADVATLNATLILSFGDNILHSSAMGGGYPIFSMSHPPRVVDEHARLVEILENEGVRVLDIRDLLTSAINNASREELEQFLRDVFPVTADEAIARIDEIDGDSITNFRDDHFYLKAEDGTFDPLFPGMPSMYWSRDFAISTPKGIVIGHGKAFQRSIENHLMRFMVQHAPELADFPIVFDAWEHDVFLDGGDFIVYDENTILLGVDNRSDREAAPLLAQTLDMDVYAVSMPPWDRRSGISRQLLHLDSTFNIVDEKTAVVVPFFMEKEYNDSNPMVPILLGIKRQMEEWQEYTDYEIGDPDAIQTTVDVIPEVGWVTHYAAGTGEATELDMKLVDWMREQGFTIVYVGGPQGDLPIEKYVLERAMLELRWQGSNVVQLRPGKIIAYAHNLYTNQALRDAGVEVVTFPGDSLSMRNGGPHCLLMPLVRGL
jgi:arginine deiminase